VLLSSSCLARVRDGFVVGHERSTTFPWVSSRPVQRGYDRALRGAWFYVIRFVGVGVGCAIICCDSCRSVLEMVMYGINPPNKKKKSTKKPTKRPNRVGVPTSPPNRMGKVKKGKLKKGSSIGKSTPQKIRKSTPQRNMKKG